MARGGHAQCLIGGGFSIASPTPADIENCHTSPAGAGRLTDNSRVSNTDVWRQRDKQSAAACTCGQPTGRKSWGGGCGSAPGAASEMEGRQ